MFNALGDSHPGPQPELSNNLQFKILGSAGVGIAVRNNWKNRIDTNENVALKSSTLSAAHNLQTVAQASAHTHTHTDLITF